MSDNWEKLELKPGNRVLLEFHDLKGKRKWHVVKWLLVSAWNVAMSGKVNMILKYIDEPVPAKREGGAG